VRLPCKTQNRKNTRASEIEVWSYMKERRNNKGKENGVSEKVKREKGQVSSGTHKLTL